MLRFAARGECAVATVQPPLRVPGNVDPDGGCAALSLGQRGTEKRMVAILPGGFDEHAAQMRIAGFGDGAAGLLGAAGMFGRD